ncbi:MAG: TspO/MBR family protein [Mariniphaga sp.]
MKQKALLVTNTLTLIFALVMSALSGSGMFNDTTQADISDRYETLVTPSGYAFSIWGLIYLLLISFTVFQWVEYLKYGRDENIKRTGTWFALSNVANGTWIIAFLNHHIGLSVAIMLILLFSLIMLTLRLRLEVWDAPVRIIAFVWWPVCIYLGWIIAATVANISVYLVSTGWQGGSISPQTWAVVIIIVASLIYLLLIYFRNMREAALVGVWALTAIAVRQWEMNASVAVAAITASVVLFIAASVHGYKNQETSPFEKIKRGEI